MAICVTVYGTDRFLTGFCVHQLSHIIIYEVAYSLSGRRTTTFIMLNLKNNPTQQMKLSKKMHTESM